MQAGADRRLGLYRLSSRPQGKTPTRTRRQALYTAIEAKCFAKQQQQPIVALIIIIILSIDAIRMLTPHTLNIYC